MVINAGCKDKDLLHLNKIIDDEFSSKDVQLEYHEEDALIAIQGPKAVLAVEQLTENTFGKLLFMESTRSKITSLGVDALFTRCGYTGEDGFEVSIKADKVVDFCDLLLDVELDGEKAVGLAGLGARDSLRLEAGLCLYGNEINEGTSPVDAILQWTISKRRKTEGGFIGHDSYMKRRKEGAP